MGGGRWVLCKHILVFSLDFGQQFMWQKGKLNIDFLRYKWCSRYFRQLDHIISIFFSQRWVNQFVERHCCRFCEPQDLPDPVDRPRPRNYHERTGHILPVQNNLLQYSVNDTENFLAEVKKIGFPTWVAFLWWNPHRVYCWHSVWLVWWWARTWNEYICTKEHGV